MLLCVTAWSYVVLEVINAFVDSLWDAPTDQCTNTKNTHTHLFYARNSIPSEFGNEMMMTLIMIHEMTLYMFVL